MEKRDWYSHYEKQFRDSSEPLNRTMIESLMPLLCTYPKIKPVPQRDVYTPMFLAALVTIAKTDKYLLTDKRIKIFLYTQRKEYCSALRKSSC